MSLTWYHIASLLALVLSAVQLQNDVGLTEGQSGFDCWSWRWLQANPSLSASVPDPPLELTLVQALQLELKAIVGHVLRIFAPRTKEQRFRI